MKRAFFTALAVVYACLLGAIGWTAIRTGEPPHRRAVDDHRTSSQPFSPPREVELSTVQQVLTAYRTQALDEIGAYVAAVRQAELDAFLASLAPPPPPVTVTPPTVAGGAVTTGECGGATNGADQFIQRESGGNPGIYNQGGSGAWGCYQIMPGTWAASCSDLGVHGQASPAAQAACASRLPLSAWAL